MFVFAALLCAAVFAGLWLVRPKTITQTSHDADLAILRAERAQLDAAEARGDVSADAALTTRNELRRRALALSRQSDQAALDPSPPGRVTVALSVAAIILAALGFALMNGPTPQDRRASTATGKPVRGSLPASGFDALMDEGQARFRAGNYAGAFDAYGAAAKAQPDRLEALLAQGEALVAAEGGQLSPASMLIFAKANEMSPGNPISEYFKGLERLQSGDAQTAETIWLSIKARSRPGAPWLPQVERGLAEAARILGAPPSEPQMGPEQIRAMVSGLAARLEDEPDDPQGWLMLARSYLVLGEPGKAKAALGQFRALPNVADDLVAEAESLAKRLKN